MIIVERSREGRRVLRKDGRLLASSMDPIKEAGTWADQALEGLEPNETLVVLGLGCGYHVEAALALRPDLSLLVIERDEQIARWASEFCPSIPRFDVIVEPDWMRLGESGRVRDVLCGVFRMRPHLPSVLADREYYGRAERFFLGRDKTSFLLQLRSRPDLFALLDADRIAALEEGTISIKTLAGLFNSSPGSSVGPSKERRLWKLLEELVR